MKGGSEAQCNVNMDWSSKATFDSKNSNLELEMSVIGPFYFLLTVDCRSSRKMLIWISKQKHILALDT